LKYLDSLMARVLKAKYYPREDFLSAKLGRRPSYAWRSIFNAKGCFGGGIGLAGGEWGEY
jgi:hypothetical protein